MKKYLVSFFSIIAAFLLLAFLTPEEKSHYSDAEYINTGLSEKDAVYTDEEIITKEDDSFNYENFSHHFDAHIDRTSYQRGGKVYPSYDEQTLVAMAEQWDIRAIKELAYRYMSEQPKRLEGHDVETINKNLEIMGDWIEKRNKYIRAAVIHGDKEFLHFSSALFPRNVDFSDPDYMRKTTLDSLAFSEFMGMRGNYSDKYLGAIVQIDLYQES